MVSNNQRSHTSDPDPAGYLSVSRAELGFRVNFCFNRMNRSVTRTPVCVKFELNKKVKLREKNKSSRILAWRFVPVYVNCVHLVDSDKTGFLCADVVGKMRTKINAIFGYQEGRNE